ncbi:BA75_03696T0 [Komagataella pastoris]|uniref:BA75_03696T0 n=1 Tax=Komagataella pastoris TaxID=4922 RepID=A0A1B2JEZ7_PICPA|nr:BA75_03696T0 [Komagataella pastoris]
MITFLIAFLIPSIMTLRTFQLVNSSEFIVYSSNPFTVSAVQVEAPVVDHRYHLSLVLPWFRYWFVSFLKLKLEQYLSLSTVPFYWILSLVIQIWLFHPYSKGSWLICYQLCHGPISEKLTLSPLEFFQGNLQAFLYHAIYTLNKVYFSPLLDLLSSPNVDYVLLFLSQMSENEIPVNTLHNNALMLSSICRIWDRYSRFLRR